nr:DUF433 domain-containing protein [Saliphagus sp. LR7]
MGLKVGNAVGELIGLLTEGLVFLGYTPSGYVYITGHRIMSMSQVASRIVRTLHDEPHLEGRRLTVRFIKEQVEDRGLDPRTVADRHDLDVADVYRALTYYHDNPAELRTVERNREAAIAEHEDRTTDPAAVREE